MVLVVSTIVGENSPRTGSAAPHATRYSAKPSAYKEGPPTGTFLVVSGRGIRVTSEWSVSPSVTIRSSPFSVTRMLLATSGRTKFPCTTSRSAHEVDQMRRVPLLYCVRKEISGTTLLPTNITGIDRSRKARGQSSEPLSAPLSRPTSPQQLRLLIKLSAAVLSLVGSFMCECTLLLTAVLSYDENVQQGCTIPSLTSLGLMDL
jgi:hypothetical protein